MNIDALRLPRWFCPTPLPLLALAVLAAARTVVGALQRISNE